MTTPLFHITLPDTDGPAHFAPLQIALEGMTKINEWHIRRNLKRAARGAETPIPPLYMSGVRYEEDPPGHEDWRDCWAVLKRGKGDCDQLTAWRVAELRAAGVAAEPVLKWQWIPKAVMIGLGYPSKLLGGSPGVWMVHCLVRFPDGTSEDPSKLLGMGGSYTSKI